MVTTMTVKNMHFLRRHIVLLGDMNAGKSTLFNALTGQQRAIVSAEKGTTTDPVQAGMELIPFGPVVLIDTAGTDDVGQLGKKRSKKTIEALRRSDAVLFVSDMQCFDEEKYLSFLTKKKPHILVFNKCENVKEHVFTNMKKKYPDAFFLRNTDKPDGSNINELHQKLSSLMKTLQPEDESLVGTILPAGSHVILVTPIDSEAPKGRLVLPQMQTLRDCLDHGIMATICREHELERVLQNISTVDLVITDSQVFTYVEDCLPKDIPLTSFSMLLAKQKGNFTQLLYGTDKIAELKDGNRILMMEGCTHNHTHEDIGRVKIPAMLRKKTGLQLDFDFYNGYDFPENFEPYAMAIQCGSCMLNRQEITARLKQMEDASFPVTNYGMVLAWGSGILTRSCEIFTNELPRGKSRRVSPVHQ